MLEQTISDPFSTGAFLQTCFKHLEGNEHTIDDKSFSLCPRSALRLEKNGPFRFLNFISKDFADYTDFAYWRSPEEETKSLLENFKNSTNYDLIIVPKIPEDSQAYKLFGKKAKEIGLEVQTSTFGVAPYLRLDGDFESFCKTKSKRFRQKNRWAEKQLSKFGKVEYLHIGSSDQLSDRLEWAYRIYESKWGGKYTSSKFIGKDRDFYLVAGKNFADQGFLDLSFIMVGDTPVAFCYGLVFKGTFFYYITAVADIPRYKPFSPGTLLLSHLIERAYEKNLDFFDFMLGNEGYKDRWTKEHRMVNTVAIVKPCTRSRLAFKLFQARRKTRKVLASSSSVRTLLDVVSVLRK